MCVDKMNEKGYTFPDNFFEKRILLEVK